MCETKAAISLAILRWLNNDTWRAVCKNASSVFQLKAFTAILN